jgi:Phospholipase_D-nuclease N-terminal
MTSHPITAPPAAAPGGRDTKSIALGVLSFAPVAAVAAVIVQFIVFHSDVSATTPTGVDPFSSDSGSSFDRIDAIEASFHRLEILVALAAIVTAVTFVVVLVDVLTNRAVAEERLTWVLVVIFGNLLGFPVYWYVVYRRRPRVSAAR